MDPNATESIINNGLLFDGTGASAAVKSIRIQKGRITEIADTPLRAAGRGKANVIDATGRWITPGFIDIHTHYDAEVEAMPELPESLRHGVTTCFLGSCSLSTAIGTADDLADMFTRVEAIPYEHLLPLLRKKKKWNSFGEYADHLNSLPLGPNLASFVGYSAVRTHVMGLDRSLDKKIRPTDQEEKSMRALIHAGLDAGYLGLSLNTLYWDKMGGTRFRSHCLPSTYASWGELSRMISIVRQRDSILQAVPNISTKYEVFAYAAFSAGLFRKKLRTSLVSLMDIHSNPQIYILLRALGHMFNKVWRADFRYQSLPEMFDLWADGIDLVVFEEFGAGDAALHLETMIEQRRALLKDPAYRRKFKSQWRNPLLPKVFHRDFRKAVILESPEAELVGKTFQQIAGERRQHVVDAFLDLIARYDKKLRWYTQMGNTRPGPLGKIIDYSGAMIGFSDAGAHLRNMAHYNFPLRMLRFVRDQERAGQPVMPLEKAVWRLTGELADWHGIEAGKLRVGDRADLVIIDPEQLDERVDAIHEENMPAFGNYRRLVRRNDETVNAVFVNGRVAVQNGKPVAGMGKKSGYGRFLRASNSQA
ncbi:MAG: N-acyl-D-glutamate amidohydrolase [Leptospiraceae bacterium]|nr:N-acyl-D-glutamate amidohydrolase [Leptospiraceae bacterium]